VNAHTRKTIAKIQSHPAPRQLKWNDFVRVWDDVADSVEYEKGDRLVVHINNERVVFHRPHNDVVSIDDIERARALLSTRPESGEAGTLLAVTIDTKGARLIDYDLDSARTLKTERDVRNSDPHARRMRAVERRTGTDNEEGLLHYFDDVAVAVGETGETFVVLGTGGGKSDVAAEFIGRLQDRHPQVAEHLAGSGSIDLSAASDSDIEAKAIAVLHGEYSVPRTPGRSRTPARRSLLAHG
jgi:arginine repressor